MSSQRREKTLPSVEDPARQLASVGINRKIMFETRKKVVNNIDIAPHISVTFMFIILLYTVSLVFNIYLPFPFVVSDSHVIIHLEARLQSNIAFTLQCILTVFTCLAITPSKVNQFA